MIFGKLRQTFGQLHPAKSEDQQDPSRWKQVDASHLNEKRTRGEGGIQEPASGWWMSSVWQIVNGWLMDG